MKYSFQVRNDLQEKKQIWFVKVYDTVCKENSMCIFCKSTKYILKDYIWEKKIKILTSRSFQGPTSWCKVSRIKVSITE